MRDNIFNPFFNSTYGNIVASQLFSPGIYPFGGKIVGPFVQGFNPLYSNIYGVINYPLRRPVTYNSKSNSRSDIRVEEEKVLNSMALSSYVYGYPLVLTMIRRYMPRTDLNKFHIDTQGSSDNSTKAYAIIDLKDGPIIYRMPEFKSGEYTVELMDAWTDLYADLSSKTTGNNKKEVLIVGPDFNKPLPDDIDIIQSPTNTTMIVTKINTNTNLSREFLNQNELIPLYEQDINYEAKKDMLDEYITNLDLNNNKTPNEIVRDMNANQFFKIMTLASYYNPPRQKDVEMNRKLAILGILPSIDFKFDSLSTDIKEALEFANRNGINYIEDPNTTEDSSNEMYYLKRAQNAMRMFN